MFKGVGLGYGLILGFYSSADRLGTLVISSVKCNFPKIFNMDVEIFYLIVSEKNLLGHKNRMQSSESSL